MRTTLAIDDDIWFAVKERARRENRSAGQVLSDLARQALIGPRVEGTGTQESFYGFDPIPPRGTPVSNALIDQLRDEELL